MRDDDLAWAARLFLGHGGIDDRSMWLAHEDLAALDRFRVVVGFGHVHRLRRRWSSASVSEAVAVYRLICPHFPAMAQGMTTS
jgi:hypothetical protein